MNAPVDAAAESLPASVYRDPGLWPHERARIFARSWQYVGHESLLKEPGAWVADVVAGYPLLAVRGHDGMLRGFHNVCRHRAGPLTRGASGRCDGLMTCQYHGWTYALDGRLRSARDFGPSPGFDPRDFGLYLVRLETWRGLVFAAIDAGIPPLAEVLAPVEARLKDADWGGLRVATTRHHHLACNWKTYVENYLEGYHVPLVHPALDAEIDVTRYAVTVEGLVAIHEAPLKKPDAVYEGLWAWAWPNTGFNVYASGVMVERMTPVGATKTRLDYIFLTLGGEAVPDETMAMSDGVLAEDRCVVERVQENLDAGIYHAGRLSPRHEAGVAAFQAFYRKAMGEVLG